ncbi:hypothetical protein Hanom_Chr02g00160311 [Helianthus anomalus]
MLVLMMGIMQEQDKGAVVEEWWMRLKMMVKVGGCRWCWDEEEVGGDLVVDEVEEVVKRFITRKPW